MVRSTVHFFNCFPHSSFYAILILIYVLGPSFKRGPPKGYITAIDHRLHQVEALLGAILQSTDARSRGIISDLKSDPVAREIIKRVELGPYGTAAHSEASGSGPVDFSGAIRRLGDSRAARDSRVKRENVSSSLGTLIEFFVV